MSVDKNVMTGAFQAGAGFSASDFSNFTVAVIAVIALVWATILAMGWLRGYRDQRHPADYLITRLMTLAIILSLIFSVLGSSSS